jgi:hypothetical protein
MLQLRWFGKLTLFMMFCVTLHAETAIDAQVKQNTQAIEQSDNKEQNSKTEKKQTLNFEDELIEGTAQKPDLFYMFQKNNFKFKKLIKLRENFLPEMARNAEDIQRLRGGR